MVEACWAQCQLNSGIESISVVSKLMTLATLLKVILVKIPDFDGIVSTTAMLIVDWIAGDWWARRWVSGSMWYITVVSKSMMLENLLKDIFQMSINAIVVCSTTSG